LRAAKRLGILAAAAGAALALAGGALGAYAPRFVVETSGVPGRPSAVTMTLTRSQADAATARVQISTPSAYGVSIVSTPGTIVGSVVAPGPGGPIVAEDPAEHAKDDCLPGLHDAVWVARSLGIALYVDAGSSSLLTIEFCLPRDLQPPVLTFQFGPGLWANPASAGEFVWSAGLMPYASDGTQNPVAEVEARAIVRQPPALSLGGKLDSHGKIVLFGRLLAGGKKLAHVAVKLLAGRGPHSMKPVSSTKTTAAGGYSFALRLHRTTYFRTAVDVPARDLTATGCKAPSFAPAGCVSATLQPFHVLSFTSLKVTVRKT
jgi:hypothetical protein